RAWPDLFEDVVCPMCVEEEETIFHMLVTSIKTCIKEQKWWDIFLSMLWGIWLRPNVWMLEKKKERMVVFYKALGIIGEFKQANLVTTVNQAAPQVKAKEALVEAMALQHALRISMDAGFGSFELETYCMKVYHHLRKGLNEATASKKVISNIILLARMCNYVSFSFVKRSRNRVAHCLGRMSCNYAEDKVWLEEFPTEVHGDVMADLASLIP
ncbi:Ent-kaurene oxidase-like 5, partial [Bienertia sinuspersici]